MATAASILIGIPTHGGVVKTRCMESLFLLQRSLIAEAIAVELGIVDSPQLVLSRNALASRVAERDKYSHLLFVDSDMAFQPATVLRMLKHGKPLIGCVYPRRVLDLDKALEGARRTTNAAAIALASQYVGHKNDWRGVTIVDGLCQVDALGMGLCLIAGSVFRDLIATGKLRAPDEAAGPGHGFFDNIVRDGKYLGEDLSFCERWRTLCGGEIWGLISEEIGHVGDFVYRAKLRDRLLAGKPAD
jgi:hypothetical protein